MKKKVLYALIIVVSYFLPGACIDDKTSTFKIDGSPIVISVQDSVFHLDFGNPLVITPEVSQKIKDLPLKYEWRCIATDGDSGSDSLRFISFEKEFRYSFPRAGSFQIRLRVENQYGSSFKYFIANVEAPFEKGILILSNDEQDNSRISFLRLKEEEELLDAETSDFNTNAFLQSNPEVALRGARDVIFTRTGELSSGPRHYVLAVSSESDQKIYFLNGRYFLIENMLNVGDFIPNTYPTVLCGNGDHMMTEIMFGTNDRNGVPGDYGFVSIRSFFVYLAETPGSYDKIILGEENLGFFVNYLGCFVDNSRSEVYVVRQGTYKYTCENRFAGMNIVNVVFADNIGTMMFVTTDKNDPQQISIHKTGTRSSWENNLVMFESTPYTYAINGDLTLTSDCKMLANRKYQYIYYNQGNKLYRWSYMVQEPKLPSEPDLILDDPDDEITCMEMSPNQEHLWVCVYNRNAKTELKGKLLIINPVTLQIEKTINGISDRALKVMWKPTKFNEDYVF